MVALQDFEAFAAIGGLHGRIAVRGEAAREDGAHRFFVVDNQHRFATGCCGFRGRRLALARRVGGWWKIECEGRALARRALA